MRKVKYLLHIFIISLFLFNNFTSCALFENDVADFMEKYTETAAIEQHSFNVETYNDASNQLCIASDGDAEITLLMRNPKTFSLIPSVDFNNLASNYSRSVVSIDQEDSFTVKLSLPQEFLIPVDEGKDITALINLHEPMSGRDFDRYTVNLSCNSKPPLILNPTIMNKGNQVFVLAFDMPNEEEVAIRHKDLAAVEINGVSYPVQVTTETDSISDPEHPDLQVARYTFTDPHFKRSNPGYSELGGKTFDHNPNNSVYFETDDPFKNGDKEYTIILRDKAGLTSEVKASTSISKLKKPVIKDQNGYEISEYDITVGGYSGIPYNEDTERGVITIYPPTEDHLNHAVSGATVYYRVYEATGSGRIYTSGSTTTVKTLELPQNTYRVEAYATLTNYENSSTTTVKFRFMNNVLYVRTCTDSEGFIGDGSALAPYATFEEAIADINDEENRPDAADKFTIYIEGDFTQPSIYAHMVDDDSDPTTPPVKHAEAAAIHGDISLFGTIRTNELVIKKMPTASTGKLKSITLADTDSSGNSAPLSVTKVTVGDVTITNNSGNGITQNVANTLVIDGTTITGCTGTGARAIQQAAGSLIIKNCNVTNNSNGLAVAGCTLCEIRNGLFDSNTGIAAYFEGNGTYTISGGTYKNNTSSGLAAIFINTDNTADCTISGGVIKENHAAGILVAQNNSSVLKLYGGEISYNAQKGIDVEATATLRVKGNPIVQNNTVGSPASTANVVLAEGKTITIDGPLTSGAKIGVRTVLADEPTAVGDAYTFASGYVNSGSPSQYFTSDKGYSIVGGSGGFVSIAKTGSSGGAYTALDYTVNMTSPSIHVGLNTAKTVNIAVSGTRKESGGTPKDLYYNNADNKFYTDPAFTTKAAGDNAVTFTAAVYNGGQKISDGDCTVAAGSEAGKIKVTIPAISFEDTYTLKVTANFMGVTKDLNVEVKCLNLSVGDIILNDGSSIPYTDGLVLTNEQRNNAIAVIFYIGSECSADGSIRILGVGLKQSNKLWCKNTASAYSVNVSSILCSGTLVSLNYYTYPFSGDVDGSDNLESLSSFLSSNGHTDDTSTEANYPAFYYAKNYSSQATNLGSYNNGWYLPSIEELYFLNEEKDIVNSALTSCGGSPVNLDTYSYWSSSQAPDTTDAWYFYQNNAWYNSDKDTSRHLLVIREF